MNIIAGTTASAALWCRGKQGLEEMISILTKLGMGLQYVPFASHMKHLEMLRRVPVVSTERLILKEMVFWLLAGKPAEAINTYNAVRRMFPDSDDIRYETYPRWAIQATGEIAASYEGLLQVYREKQLGRLYFDSTHSQTTYNGAHRLCDSWYTLYTYMGNALRDGLRVGLHLQPLRTPRNVPLGATVFYESDSFEKFWGVDPSDPYVNFIAVVRGCPDVPIVVELPIHMAITPGIYEASLEKSRNAIQRILGPMRGFASF